MAGERWLDEQLAQLGRDHPSFSRAGAWLLEHRIPFLVALCAGLAASVDAVVSFNDMALFVASGHRLASTAGLDVFADPRVQVGALTLALVEASGRLGSLIGLPAGVAATAALAALASYVALRTSAAIQVLPPRLAVVRDLGLAACLALGPLATAALYGHLEEVLVAVGLVAAGELARRRHDLAAGGVLGACVALKLWGVLGLPVLLFALTPRSARRRLLAAGAVVLVAYGPFFAFGDVATFHYRWLVTSQSPLGLLDPQGVFDWRLRLLQVALAVGVGAWLAVRPGAQPWLVVCGVVAVRLLTDPGRSSYYATALVVCLLVGLWARHAASWASLGPALAVGAVVLTVGDYTATGVVLDWLRDAFVLLALVAVVRMSRRLPAPGR
jgi:hypothetical protein